MKATILLLALAVSCTGMGQAFRIPVKQDSRLQILDLSGLIQVEGESSYDMIIKKLETSVPEGMPDPDGTVYPADNTGIGLHLEQQDPLMIIRPASRAAKWQNYSFTIPRNSLVRISNYESQSASSKETGANRAFINGIYLKDLTGELEVSSWCSPVYLDSITGPVTIHTVDGDIRADYLNLNQKGVHSYQSVKGNIDLLVPDNSSYRQVKTITPDGRVVDLTNHTLTRYRSAGKAAGVEIVTESVNGQTTLIIKKKTNN